MARQARIKDYFGIYHIRQRCNEHTILFKDDIDRNEFLSIVLASKEKNDFKLYGYCLANPKGYQLIINSNGADISRIMQEINIRYALYLDLSLPVFKDRYKSELISDKEALMSILEEMHTKGREVASNYNSYCFYDEIQLQTTFLIDKEDLRSLPADCKSINKQNNECIRSISQAKERLNHLAKLESKNLEELLKDKEGRNMLIKEFRRNSTLTLKELGLVFGNLSESTICKVLNS